VANCCCEAAATRDAVRGPCQPKCSLGCSCHATAAIAAADVDRRCVLTAACTGACS
jgi:hypothetical protein